MSTLNAVIFAMIVVELILSIVNISRFERAAKQNFTFWYRHKNGGLVLSDILTPLAFIAALWMIVVFFVSIWLGIVVIGTYLIFVIVSKNFEPAKDYIMNPNEQTKREAIKASVVSLVLHIALYVLTIFVVTQTK